MVQFTVNGKLVTADAPTNTPLLWVLRDTLGLTGTKYGCGIAECGACTVVMDGLAVRSCTTLLSEAAGKSVVTIEGLGTPENLHPIQRAWIEEDVVQCGYCQSGHIMEAAALLKANPEPTDAQIEEAYAGRVCRCGTYQRIHSAVKLASRLLKEGGGK